MVLQFEQKFLSDEQSSSFGVPRSLIAQYFLSIRSVHLNQIICPGVAAQVGASCAWVVSYLMMSFPLMMLRLSAMPPKFTLPRCPPTLRQMLHAHSWYGTGVWESKVNSTPPHWQLPSNFLVTPSVFIGGVGCSRILTYIGMTAGL